MIRLFFCDNGRIGCREISLYCANFKSCGFPLMILLTADAVEFTIAPVVRGIQFSGGFGNRGGG